jgi:hypothetical protein
MTRTRHPIPRTTRMKATKPANRRKLSHWDIADIRDALELAADIAMDHKEPFEVYYGKAGRALDRIATALFGTKNPPRHS